MPYGSVLATGDLATITLTDFHELMKTCVCTVHLDILPAVLSPDEGENIDTEAILEVKLENLGRDQSDQSSCM